MGDGWRVLVVEAALMIPKFGVAHQKYSHFRE
jgi:hypothetical protein